MTTEQDFIDALDREPDNHTLRLIYSDWLEEQGDERARGIRALGVLQRVACVGASWEPEPRKKDKNRYWIQAGSSLRLTWKSMQQEIDQATLPMDWCYAIKWMADSGEVVEKWNWESGWYGYRIRKEVEDLAALAFLKLPVERQEELLKQLVLC